MVTTLFLSVILEFRNLTAKALKPMDAFGTCIDWICLSFFPFFYLASFNVMVRTLVGMIPNFLALISSRSWNSLEVAQAFQQLNHLCAQLIVTLASRCFNSTISRTTYHSSIFILGISVHTSHPKLVNANSPWGNCMIFQGKRAPDQFETKINRNKALIKGTHGPYSSTP